MTDIDGGKIHSVLLMEETSARMSALLLTVYYKVGDENREPIMQIFRETSDFHMRMQMYKCGKIANTALNHFWVNLEKSRVFEDTVHYDFAFFLSL